VSGYDWEDGRDTERAETVNARDDEREDVVFVEDFGDQDDCTHCNGEGTCDDNADPLWDCDDNPHPCHACGGSGRRRDQRIF
jgi:DnaJ-class molecular chaperone